MNLHFIRPEDRRRSGSSGVGSEWADTEPVCFRSEAFAEDLHADEGGGTPVPQPRRFEPARLLRRGHGRVPVFGLALAAALGLGLGD